MPKIDYPLGNYVNSQHPLLYASLLDARPAQNPTITWQTPEGTRTNYTQIVRNPFAGGEREKWRAFERHLDAIEATLWDGVPERSLSGGYPLTMCGGVHHFLGREPLRADTIRFRPLQDCVLLTERGVNGEAEFLTEFSLEVVPAPAIKRGV